MNAQVHNSEIFLFNWNLLKGKMVLSLNIGIKIDLFKHEYKSGVNDRAAYIVACRQVIEVKLGRVRSNSRRVAFWRPDLANRFAALRKGP